MLLPNRSMIYDSMKCLLNTGDWLKSIIIPELQILGPQKSPSVTTATFSEAHPTRVHPTRV